METRRPSRLPNPPCGMASYCSTPEDPGVLCCVTFVEGDQVAEIMEGEDVGVVFRLEKGMPGVFHHSAR